MIFSISNQIYWPSSSNHKCLVARYLENLEKEGGMKIISDPDDDVFIDENKSLLK